ncbi:hypothetical protein CF15_04815 [Pyrodictium occultum]|uniref:FAD dependent oxidoreductase domain-containing protein n=1 Tax=Pyrodictium occultum TaxID=2309 RepID=A0A0V8RVM1_PYROC|nr:FAD-binding oxidoreductase [Pyrodictium occultum]KSW12095.1 hypothetical protein CF15_04815 [Pyrodictium occultum]
MTRVDVLVVGAGIIGLSSAFHVKRLCPSCRVLLVEKHPGPGHGDTGRSAAAFRAFFTSRTNMALAASSIAFYREVQEREGFDLGMRFTGYLFLLTEEQHQALAPVLEELRRRGLGYRVYSPEELEELLGLRTRPGGEEAELMQLPGIDVGVLAENAGIIRPERLVEYYSRRIGEMGVEALYNTRVEKILVEPEQPLGVPGEPLPWQKARVVGAATSRGEIRADVTIVAGGAETPFLLDPVGVDIHAKPKKRQVFVIRADRPELRRLLHAEGFNSLGLAPFILLPKGVYIRPAPEDNAFWVGASDHLGRPFSWEPDPQPEEHFYEYGIYPVLHNYLPAFENARPSSAWAGFYDISIDGQPVVLSEPGLVAAAGTSGSGIMKADAVGRIAASLALGKKRAALYGGEEVDASILGTRSRRVEEERLVI